MWYSQWNIKHFWLHMMDPSNKLSNSNLENKIAKISQADYHRQLRDRNPIDRQIRNPNVERRYARLMTLLTVSNRSAVTIAPFRTLTASPVSRACVLAQVGNTHSSAPYHSEGSPKFL